MYGGLLRCGGFVFLDQGFARGQSQTPILALALVQVLVLVVVVVVVVAAAPGILATTASKAMPAVGTEQSEMASLPSPYMQLLQ